MFNMDQRIFIFLSVGLLLFSPCCMDGGQGITPVKKLTAQEIVEKSDKAMENVNSYGLDMKLVMVYSNATELGGEMVLEMDSKSQMDIRNRRMYMNAQVNVMGMSMPVESYIIGDIQYSKAPMAGWTKQKINISWDENEGMIEQMNLVGNPELTLDGSEEVDGVDCYIIKTVPTAETIFQIMGQGVSDSSGMAEGSRDDFMKGVESMEFREWISKTDFTVKKAYIKMDVDAQGGSSSMEITIKLSDLNKAMNIELPAEAENAQEMSEFLTGGGVQPY